MVSRGIRRVRAHRPGSRGQALVELALVVPILLVLTLAALDLGRIYYARITVENAAREGAIQAAADPTDGAGITAAATRETSGSMVTVTAADVTYTCDPGCTKAYGTEVTVNVRGSFTLMTPLMASFTGGQTVNFQSTAIADVIYLPPAPVTTTTSSSTSSTTTTTTSTTTTTTTTSTTSTTSSTTTVSCSAPLVSFSTAQNRKQDPVVFTSTSSPTSGPCGITYWRWEFGDGSTDAGNTPTTSHDYGAPYGRTFPVKLTVTYGPDNTTVFLTTPITTKG